MSEAPGKANCTFEGCVLNAHYMVLHPDPEVRHVGYACYKHAREHDYRPFRLVPLHPIGPPEAVAKKKEAPGSSERSLVMGSAGGEHLRIVALRRQQPDSRDFWEGNWLDCAIDASAGGFQGAVNCHLRTEELFAFRDALRQLEDRLAAAAIFETAEQCLAIEVIRSTRTGFHATCELRDATAGNRLSFTLSFGGDGLLSVIASLDEMLRGFPVVGR